MPHLVDHGLPVFRLDAPPRNSRAQNVDVLGARSTVSGGRSACVRAERTYRFLAMLMTPAGTMAPARMLVPGAGAAGLLAAATGHRPDAVAQAVGARPVVKRQAESRGASCLTVSDVMAGDTGGYARAVAADEETRHPQFLAGVRQTADIVILDRASESSGNGVLTVPGSVVECHGGVPDGFLFDGFGRAARSAGAGVEGRVPGPINAPLRFGDARAWVVALGYELRAAA